MVLNQEMRLRICTTQVRLHQLVHTGLHRLLDRCPTGRRVLLVHHRTAGPPTSDRVHRSFGGLRHPLLRQRKQQYRQPPELHCPGRTAGLFQQLI